MDELELMGIRIIKPYENEQEIDAFTVDDFIIHSFHVFHDSTPCCGFMIECDGKLLLYVTDAEYVRYKFKKLKVDYILVECNYQEDRVDLESEHLAHIVRGHLSLETCIDFLKANATDKLRHIILCHLSKVNADPIECQMAVCKAIPNVMVNIATKGLELQL